MKYLVSLHGKRIITALSLREATGTIARSLTTDGKDHTSQLPSSLNPALVEQVTQSVTQSVTRAIEGIMASRYPSVIDGSAGSYNRRKERRSTYYATEKGEGTSLEIISNIVKENFRTNEEIIEECDRNIPIESLPGRPDDRGKLLVRYTAETGRRQLREATEEEIQKTKLIVFGGKDTGHGIGLSAISGLLEQLLHVSSPEVLWETIGGKPVAFHHEIGVFASDRDSACWNQDKHYISPEMQRFSERYIIPRFVNADGKLRSAGEVEPLIFFTFSAGRKKAHLALNAAIDFLKSNHALTDQEIQEYTKSLSIVSICHFPDFNQHRFPRFGHTVTIVGADDLGPRPTKDIYYKILLNQDVTSRPFSSFYLKPEPSDNVIRDMLFILGAGRLPAQYQDKPNFLGHNPKCMIQAISTTLPKEALEFLNTVLFASSKKDIEPQLLAIAQKSVAYSPLEIANAEETSAATPELKCPEAENYLFDLAQHYNRELYAESALEKKKQDTAQKWTEKIALPSSENSIRRK